MRGRGVSLGKCKKCQNYRSFDIFMDILHKIKGTLGQERVKRGLLFFPGKNWNEFPCYPWKTESFSSFDPIFHPSLPKIWLSHPSKNYIFVISDNRAIHYKSFIILS